MTRLFSLLLLSFFATSCGGGGDGDGDADADADIAGDADDADADADEVADADEDPWIPPPVPEAVISRADGWLRGDLHQHTSSHYPDEDLGEGDDSIALVVDIAQYLQHPDFLELHPEFEDAAFDFMAITDHRTIAGLSDPEFDNDEIILVPGEEFGSAGHAGVWGIQEFVDHDPDGDGVSLEDYQAGVDHTHEQGGLFSPNHPFLEGYPFPFDIRNIDGVEVWNSGWALMGGELSEEELLLWEETYGPASPLFWRAIQDQGRGNGMQSLTYYEALLSRGIHPAIVGGSDRHMVLLMGFPTTYVHAETSDLDGVLAGIAARHTFVARTPVSAQMVMTATVGDEEYMMGDAIPVPAEGAEVTLSVLVGRANGGLLQLISGEAVESDDAIADAPLGEIYFTEDITEDRVVAETTITAMPGTWVYPLLFEQLYVPTLSESQRELVHNVAIGSLATGGEDFAAAATILVEVVDVNVVLGMADCLREDWTHTHPHCLPVDDNDSTTIYIPDHLDRGINVVSEGGEPTEWTMGAVGSAILFVAAE